MGYPLRGTPSLSSSEFAEFNGLLESAVDRGLPREPCVPLLGAQTRGKVLREALLDVARALRDGTALHVAQTRYPRVFPPPYVRLIQAAHGEGRLAEALRYVETDYLLRARTLQKARGVLACFLFGFAVFETVR